MFLPAYLGLFSWFWSTLDTSVNQVVATLQTKGGPTDMPTVAGIVITYVTVLVSAIKLEGAISIGAPTSAI